MAGSPHPVKRKVTYFENKNVLAALEKLAEEESKQAGHKIYVSELIREMSLKLANSYLETAGKKPIDYDPSSGKFAPGGVPMPGSAVVDEEGKLTVYDKKEGRIMTEWRHLKQLPALIRNFPRVKVRYDMEREKKSA